MNETVPVELPLKVGDNVQVRRTITESDVYLYAGITGDFNENHVDATSPVARDRGRIAHGAYLVGLMSTASSLIHARHGAPTVSYGYDRVRFIKPVAMGDTITVDYVVSRIDRDSRRGFCDIRCTNQRGELVSVATHITKFLEIDRDAS